MLRDAGARVQECDDSPEYPGAGSSQDLGLGAAPGSGAGGEAGDQERTLASAAARQQSVTSHHQQRQYDAASTASFYHLIFSQVIARCQRLARVLSIQPRLSAEAVEGSPDILSHIEPLLP